MAIEVNYLLILTKNFPPTQSNVYDSLIHPRKCTGFGFEIKSPHPNCFKWDKTLKSPEFNRLFCPSDRSELNSNHPWQQKTVCLLCWAPGKSLQFFSEGKQTSLQGWILKKLIKYKAIKMPLSIHYFLKCTWLSHLEIKKNLWVF